MDDFHNQAPYAWAFSDTQPDASGRIRVTPEDFVVDEVLGFEPDDEGPHWLISVTKTSRNTVDVATWLSSLCRLPLRDIGYCGLKDRHAVTTQWFSLPAASVNPDELMRTTSESFTVNAVHAHRRKLKRGNHRANRFSITVRDVNADSDALLARLATVARSGVPNYFGPQRFGPDGDNVRAAMSMLLAGKAPRRRSTRSILLSSIRSALFNRVLSARVEAQTWNQLLDGDVAMLDGSRSHFVPDADDATLTQRLNDLDIHPTGPLTGTGEPAVRGEVATLESGILGESVTMVRALQAAGLGSERRALRTRPQDLAWEVRDDGCVRLEFALQRGSYATAVLRELLVLPQDVAPWGLAARTRRAAES